MHKSRVTVAARTEAERHHQSSGPREVIEETRILHKFTELFAMIFATVEMATKQRQIPIPRPLVLTGNLNANWKVFHRDWKNYEIASKLSVEIEEVRVRRSESSNIAVLYRQRGHGHI